MTIEEIDAVTALIKGTIQEKAGGYEKLMRLTDADYQAAAIKIIQTIDTVRGETKP